MPMSDDARAAGALAEAVRTTGPLVTRYLDGFDDDAATRSAPGLPNHVVWILGHLALTLHRGAERLAGHAIDLPWDPEPFAYGSTPVDGTAAMPGLATMAARFDAALDILAATIVEVGDIGLDRSIEWGSGRTMTGRALVLRLIFHNGTHTGQIVDVRRAFGMERVV